MVHRFGAVVGGQGERYGALLQECEKLCDSRQHFAAAPQHPVHIKNDCVDGSEIDGHKVR
jgi:hypothetical protein